MRPSANERLALWPTGFYAGNLSDVRGAPSFVTRATTSPTSTTADQEIAKYLLSDEERVKTRKHVTTQPAARKCR
jgi:hypothetical protein